jgi:hypothetical protein
MCHGFDNRPGRTIFSDLVPISVRRRYSTGSTPKHPGRLTPASSLIRQNPPSLRVFILWAQIGTEKAYLISQESRDRRRGGESLPVCKYLNHGFFCPAALD